MPRILVVDDEEGVCWAFKKFLTGKGYEVHTAATAEQGLRLVREISPALLILDVRLPGMDGLTALKKVRKIEPALPVIVMTAYTTMETAVEAVREGAFEYLTKPIDIDHSFAVIERALRSIELSKEVSRLRAEVVRLSEMGSIAGRSPAMQEVYKKIGAVAATDAAVLIEGESGTGKELVARAIHYNSERRSGPFVALSCGALPETLLESELFGHEKGAFTGAVEKRDGKFKSADGGTLFLDEISAASLSAQVRLLRFLEEKEFERVGSNERIRVDARIIAATNESLPGQMKEGKFREDLFYRLNVVNIKLPPLRERKEDIPLLVAHFLSLRGRAKIGVSKEALDILLYYDFPGNVRELRNAVEHAAVLSRGGPILPEHLPEHIVTGGNVEKSSEVAMIAASFIDRQTDTVTSAYDQFAALWEKPLLEKTLKRFAGNQVKAAKFLGISRSTLRKKMKLYHLQ